MKILLLNPPFKGKFSRSSRSPAVTRGGTIYYPIWLAYCAGVLDNAGFEIKIIDSPAQKFDLEKTLRLAQEFNPDLIIIDTSTPSIKNDIRAAEAIKNRLSETFITLVGTHPSALPEETLRLSDKINAVAKGEYDYTIRDLARCLKNNEDLKKVDGLIFRDGENIIHNKPRELIQNPNELPFVSSVYKKYLNIKNYFFAASDYPMVMIMTGRGCAYRCFFCLYPQTFHSRVYRPRSAENVVEEIELLKRDFGIKEIIFYDDTITFDRERIWKICRLLIEKRLNIKWKCETRVNLVDKELLQKMSEAGCYMVAFGIESGSQRVLDILRKGITLQQIENAVGWANGASISVLGYFMLGIPGETEEEIEATIKLAKRLNIDYAQFSIATAFPGTELYEIAKKAGKIDTDWSKSFYALSGVKIETSLSDVPIEKLRKYVKKAYRSFYFRPRFVFKKIAGLRSASDLFYNLKGLRTLLKI